MQLLQEKSIQSTPYHTKDVPFGAGIAYIAKKDISLLAQIKQIEIDCRNRALNGEILFDTASGRFDTHTRYISMYFDGRYFHTDDIYILDELEEHVLYALS